jgi:nucleoside-diphosphate-sugar epimerase
MKNILILGGTGFIGSNFITKFYKKYDLTILIRRKKNKIFLNNQKKIKIKKIFFKNYNELKNKIEKKNFSHIINLATHYDKGNSYKEITKILDSNVVYPSIVLSLLNLKKIKKIINIGSMLEHENKKSYNPFNLYAASKVAFQDIILFYKKKFPKIQFYNLKFFETYGFFDKRNKILNIIKKKNQKNLKINLMSKNLKLNFLNINDVVQAIDILINYNIQSGEYLVKSKNFTKVENLIKKYNKNSKKLIKYCFLNKKIISFDYKIKKLPFWKQNYFIEKEFKQFMKK